MKIPKHIIKKIIKLNDNALEMKSLTSEVEEWLETIGINTDVLRQKSLSVLELAEYGELDIENVEMDLLMNIQESQNE